MERQLRREGNDRKGALIYIEIQEIYKSFYVVKYLYLIDIHDEDHSMECLNVQGRVEGTRPREMSPTRWADQINSAWEVR